MKIVNVHDAKTNLSQLLAEVEAGEEVTIARNGTPVAMLVKAAKPVCREPGDLRDLPGWEDFVYDPALFRPMTDAEIQEEGWV